MIIPLASPAASLETAGGKGANLARLTRAGFNVPPGFIITTAAYRAFISANRLEALIQSILGDLTGADMPGLETASAAIRAAFTSADIPVSLTGDILSGYAGLHQSSPTVDPLPVAVRSSATAEDLPDQSFAGQQDTFLNVIGDSQLLRAVVDCWSSLWTARAIGYRIRNAIPHAGVELAVVVQVMLQADVSGVLFTANPLSGLLSESVIDAVSGLGEALVSGQVDPDHYVFDVQRDETVTVTLGARNFSTRARAGGGVENIQQSAAPSRTLPDADLRKLVAVGQAIQNEYNAPQDIEWAFVGGNLFILQARAITSLFPIPAISFDPLMVWFSFGAVQGLLGPVTPLGRDAIRHLAHGAGRMFGDPPLERIPPPAPTTDIFAQAGQRLWVRISDVIRHPLGSRIFSGALGFIEPSIGGILRSLNADPRLGVGRGRFKFSTFRSLAHFAFPVLARLARNMFFPAQARARFEADIDAYLSAASIPPAADRFSHLANIIAYMRDRIANAFAFLMPKFIPIFGPAMASLNILNHFSRELAMEVTRGIPDNVTTAMDLALWQTASAIRSDPPSAQLFEDTDSALLASRFLAGDLPPAAQVAVARFMDRYGMRGLGEIDFGQPRWREQPAPLINTLQSYLRIDPASAPNLLFARGEQSALAAVEQLATLASAGHAGFIKEKVVRAAARRVRLLVGARESPKFFAIRAMGIARRALMEVGLEFVGAGTIDQPDDLVFLTLDELEQLAASRSAPAADWKSIVAGRRAAYQRELRRRQVPRVLVSDGRAFYEGLGSAAAGGDLITGSPVSPGVVVGIVHVVLDPHTARLIPGEILVCPGTDPAWTPLFMAAGGLVTEVGGMMTHGSVVAREYGIPAVVGVHQATLRLKNGQRIRLDGTTGTIEILP